MGRGSRNDKAGKINISSFNIAPLRRRTPAEKAWTRGFDAFAQNNWTEAKEAWLEAVAADPGMADAWLGLHALEPNSMEYLTQLVYNLDRLGQAQDTFRKKLYSIYTPTWFSVQTLLSSDDALRAYAHALSRRGDHNQARQIANRCGPSPDTDAVKLKIDLADKKYRDCIERYQTVDWPQDLQFDVKLLSSIAFFHSNMQRQAISGIQEAIKTAPHDIARKSAIYQLGEMYQQMGQEGKARQQFEAIASEDINFLDVAQRLGQQTTSESGHNHSPVARQKPKLPWKDEEWIEEISDEVVEEQAADQQPTREIPLKDQITRPIPTQWSQEQQRSAQDAGLDGIDFDRLADR